MGCKTERNKRTKKQTNKLIDTDDRMAVARGKRGGGKRKRVKGVRYVVTEGA